MTVYRAFGETLDWGFPLTAPLRASSDRPEGRVEIVGCDPTDGSWRRRQPRFVSTEMHRGRPAFVATEAESTWVLQFRGLADMFVQQTHTAVLVHDASCMRIIELRLLGMVTSMRAHLRGRLALHASAVEVGGRAVGVLAPNGGGKSSVLTAAIGRGCRFLTDDLLVIDQPGSPVAFGGYPQLRLWPDQLVRLGYSEGAAPAVHPGTDKRLVAPGGHVSEGPCGVEALYVLDRSAGRCDPLARLSPGEAAAEVFRSAFLIDYLRGFGWAAPTLERSALLVNDLPVYRVPFAEPRSGTARLLDRIMDVSARSEG